MPGTARVALVPVRILRGTRPLGGRRNSGTGSGNQQARRTVRERGRLRKRPSGLLTPDEVVSSADGDRGAVVGQYAACVLE